MLPKDQKSWNRTQKENRTAIFRRRMHEKSLNEKFQLGDGTVCKWVRAVREECGTDPVLNDTKILYEEDHRLRRELEEKKKEIRDPLHDNA